MGSVNLGVEMPSLAPGRRVLLKWGHSPACRLEDIPPLQNVEASLTYRRNTGRLWMRSDEPTSTVISLRRLL